MGFQGQLLLFLGMNEWTSDAQIFSELVETKVSIFYVIGKNKLL